MSEVIYRKYRPKLFKEVVGQRPIKVTLQNEISSGQVAHAYLFVGPRGTGKTTLARLFARSLNCLDRKDTESEPCNKCQACQNFLNNQTLDVIEIDAASHTGVDNVRENIIASAQVPPFNKNGYKIFVIDEVHMLSKSSFNALLKTLEEPPEFVKFILATTDPLKIPATILSRTQHFRFKKISSKDVQHHLTHILNIENIDFEQEALEVLARSGEGSLRDTLTLLDQAIIYSKGNVNLSSVTDMMGMIDPIFMQKFFDMILTKGDTTQFLNDLESYDAGQVIDEMTIFLKYRMLEKSSKFDIYLFDRFFRILGDAKQLLAINSDSGFVLILTILKMIEATNLKTIDEIILEVQNTEVKVKTQVPTENNLYSQVITKIYARNHNLGECFEKSFTVNSYKDNKLLIF